MTGFANKHFSTQDFPINFIKQRYITLETPVKQNSTEIPLLPAGGEKNGANQSILSFTSSIRNSQTNSSSSFFLKLFLIPSPLHFKIPNNFVGGNYTFIIPISIAGQ